MSFTARTAGISSALARMSECEVIPPSSVIIPTTFSLLMRDVTESVSSFTTSTVPCGTFSTSTSLTPISAFKSPVLISLTSAARWLISSSSMSLNILIKPSRTASDAASALRPSSIFLLMGSMSAGSDIIRTCPSRISASLEPMRLLTDSAASFVIFLRVKRAPSSLFFSALASLTITASYLSSCSLITQTFPIPMPPEAAIPLYI